MTKTLYFLKIKQLDELRRETITKLRHSIITWFCVQRCQNVQEQNH